MGGWAGAGAGGPLGAAPPPPGFFPVNFLVSLGRWVGGRIVCRWVFKKNVSVGLGPGKKWVKWIGKSTHPPNVA